MDVAIVRKQLVSAIERARSNAKERRRLASEAQAQFDGFLEHRAAPLARQLSHALKAEGLPFTVYTPQGGLRLASDHGRDDYIELSLDTTGDTPQVIGRTSYSRGSRTLTNERPVKAHTGPAALTDDDLLAYFLDALEPWFER